MNRFQHVRSFDDLSYVSRQSKHILTLFSGGVDSSYLLYKLSQSGCKVTAFTVDPGDGVHAEDLRDIAGFFNVDLQVIDAHEVIIPVIHANAQYMGIYPISSSLSRPLMARLAIEQAELLGCDAILHTANQSQNSLRHLNGALHQLNFTGLPAAPMNRRPSAARRKSRRWRRSVCRAFRHAGSVVMPISGCVSTNPVCWTIRKISSCRKLCLSGRHVSIPNRTNTSRLGLKMACRWQ